MASKNSGSLQGRGCHTCLLFCSCTKACTVARDVKTSRSITCTNSRTQKDFQSPALCGSLIFNQWFDIYFLAAKTRYKRYPLQKTTSHQRCGKLRFWGELLWLLPSVHINSVWHSVYRREGEPDCAHSVGCADERASNAHWQPVAWKLLAGEKARTPSSPCLSRSMSD